MTRAPLEFRVANVQAAQLVEQQYVGLGVVSYEELLPGEWYGGQLHLQPPASARSGAAKTYSIALNVGSDRHQIDIVQENAR